VRPSDQHTGGHDTTAVARTTQTGGVVEHVVIRDSVARDNATQRFLRMGAEHPGGGAAIGTAAGLAARETLFDFVNPQHAGRDGFGGLNDGSP